MSFLASGDIKAGLVTIPGEGPSTILHESPSHTVIVGVCSLDELKYFFSFWRLFDVLLLSFDEASPS